VVEAKGLGRHDEQADQAARDPGQAVFFERQPHALDEALLGGLKGELCRGSGLGGSVRNGNRFGDGHWSGSLEHPICFVKTEQGERYERTPLR